MGYLDGSSIVVDAVLTKLGRKKLATGGALNITKFALGDTGIDYTLFNVDHPSGSSSYASAITQLPQLEAVTGETQALRYKLVTFSRDTEFIPYLFFPEGRTRTISGFGSVYEILISPSTVNAEDSLYQFTINDTAPIIYTLAGQTAVIEGSGPTGFPIVGVPAALEIPTPVTLIGTGPLALQAKQSDKKRTLSVQVMGVDTGATDFIEITVLKNDTVDGQGTDTAL